MKRWKILTLLCLVAALSVGWIAGCTGEDETIGGGGGASPTVTPSPTGTSGGNFPVVTVLTTLVSGRPSIFSAALWGLNTIYPFTNGDSSDGATGNYAGEYVFWVEKLGSAGKVSTFKNAKTFSADIATGLNLPSAFVLHRTSFFAGALKDFMFVADLGGGSGGSLYRYAISDSGNPRTAIATGLQGNVVYLDIDDELLANPYVYFTMNSGGSNNSVLARVSAYTANAPIETLDSTLSLPHHVYVYKHYIPAGATDPASGTPVNENGAANTFVFVTQQAPLPNGAVYMYNVTGWNGSSPLSGSKVRLDDGSQSNPSKMTFVPDIEEYKVGADTIYGHSRKAGGYLYWTNFNFANSELWRVRLDMNSNGTNLAVTGAPVRVAQALRQAYDVVGPDDYRYVFTKLSSNKKVQVTGFKYNVWAEYSKSGGKLFNQIYVSRNESQGDGGNWYEIDLTGFTDASAALTPSSSQVKNYISQGALYPLNGVMQLLLYDKEDGTVPFVYEKDLYFSGSPFEGGDSTNLYLYKNSFSPAIQ
jgi:hypothetical protein